MMMARCTRGTCVPRLAHSARTSLELLFSARGFRARYRPHRTQLGGHGAEEKRVAVTERVNAAYTLPSHRCPVFAAEILDRGLIAGNDDPRVMPRDRGLVEPDGGVAFSADDVLPLPQIELLVPNHHLPQRCTRHVIDGSRGK